MANFNLGRNEEAFMVLMEALGGTNSAGESYSYYMFDIKHAEPEESQRKVQVAIKVIYDGNRGTAKNNIADALGDLIEAKGVGISVVPHGTKAQLDYVVREGQVIRVEIKPPSSAGSGGGAAGTTLQESAMCVYAAIRYTWPNGDFVCDATRCHQVLNDNHFKVALNKCKLGKSVKLDDIKNLDKEWKDSLCLGANKIFDTIGSGDYTFERGDVVDSAIGKAFSACNKKPGGGSYFSNRNKWNPSDIWMYPTGTQNTLVGKKKQRGGKGGSGILGETTIDCLNKHMEDLLDNDELIGISLKKITHDANATMKPLNQGGAAGFAQRKRADKTEFLGAKSKSMVVFDNGTKQVKQPDKKWPMDIYLYWGTGIQDRFQARNFGGPNSGAWQLELKGVSANQGKIKGDVVLSVLKNAGFIGMPSEIGFSQCSSQKPTDTPNKITNDIYNLLNHFNAKGLTNKATDINIIKTRSKSYRFSKINGLNFLKWLEDNNGSGSGTVASQAMKEIYLYASSQGDKASVYYKLT